MRPDFILKNVMVFQTFRQCFEKRDVAVAGEKFYCVSPAISYPGVREIDGKGRYMLPGLVDIHMHIESSMTYPGEFSRITLPYGVTTVVADAHEMANVFGMDGIRAFLDTVEQDGCTEGRRLLFGVAADKDCRHMIQRVITSGLFDRIAFTHMRTARSLSLEELKGLLAAYPEDRFTMYTEADTALRTEVSGRQPGERLYIAGSLYLVGEIKESLDHDQF